jgi:hypothetical protein
MAKKMELISAQIKTAIEGRETIEGLAAGRHLKIRSTSPVEDHLDYEVPEGKVAEVFVFILITETDV